MIAKGVSFSDYPTLKEERAAMKRKGIKKGIVSFLTTAAMVIGSVSGIIPGMSNISTVYAAEVSYDTSNIGLGTGAIHNPVAPSNDGSLWTGSYVYYGKYDGTNPTKYRVLDKASTDFSVGGAACS